MLKKKLLRTFLRYKAQFISMIIMIALGVGVFLGFNMEWYSLEKDVGLYLERQALRITGSTRRRLFGGGPGAVKQIDGVEDATRFLTVNTTVKDDTDVIAIAVSENMNVSGLYLIEGEEYDETSTDGLWLSDQYAGEKRHLRR